MLTSKLIGVFAHIHVVAPVLFNEKCMGKVEAFMLAGFHRCFCSVAAPIDYSPFNSVLWCIV